MHKNTAWLLQDSWGKKESPTLREESAGVGDFFRG